MVVVVEHRAFGGGCGAQLRGVGRSHTRGTSEVSGPLETEASACREARSPRGIERCSSILEPGPRQLLACGLSWSFDLWGFQFPPLKSGEVMTI